MSSLRDPFSQLEYTGWQRVACSYDAVWGGLTQLFIGPLLDALGLEAGMVLLDVACGPGYVAEAVRAAAAAPLGLDFSPAMVRRATPATARSPSFAATPKPSPSAQGRSTRS